MVDRLGPVQHEQPRIILVEVSDESREVMAQRLSAQGYAVETAKDPETGANLALDAPPAAVIADLWMPGVSGIQLCRLLRSEPATADVPIILRGETDDPRSRFWAERAGAAAFVRKGRMGELVRALTNAIASAPEGDGFFMQLGSNVDIRERIARQLDTALFESVIAAEVRSLASCASFDRLFDLLAQFLSQVIRYRWLAVSTTSPDHFALHHHPHAEDADPEARAALGLSPEAPVLRVVDEDAYVGSQGPAAIVRTIRFGNAELGKIALCPLESADDDTGQLLELVARELGGPVRVAALIEEQGRLATSDPLTGVFNRRAMLERTTVELARAQRYDLPLSIVLLDVDHFKAINDGHGHAAGDQVLSAMGRLLRGDLRTSDLVARWGGEEFVVALTNTDLAGAELAAERLRASIEKLVVTCPGGAIPVTASLGVAQLGPYETLESLIDRADRAMYAAKVQGRNRVIASAQPARSEPASLSRSA